MRRRQSRPFTLLEAIAAMVLTAIVLPVVMHATAVAGRASEMARRTEQAARLADLELQELVLTGDWQTSDTSGNFADYPGYTWEFLADDWGQDSDFSTSMTQLTVTVHFSVQGQPEAFSLVTLVQGAQQTTQQSTPQATSSANATGGG